MLPYKSFISWNVFGIEVYSFGLMVAIGFLSAFYLTSYLNKKKGLPQERINDFFFYCLVGGIIGSRLAYVIENYSDFSNFIDIFKIWQGGLSFFGGLLGAFILCYLYIKKNKLDFFMYADMIIPSLVLGQFFGRIGCILGDGGHVGKITTMPWGFLIKGHPKIILNETIRHVTAYYSIIFLLIIFCILMFLKQYKLRKGVLFSSYLIMFSVARFISDFFRIDPLYYGLTITQWFLMFVCVLGVIIIFKKRK